MSLFRTVLLACFVLSNFTHCLHADEYPSRPIRLILGPTPEALPRLVSEFLQKELGQPVIVEPRPGGGGEIASRAVATAEPDGYTLLWASSNYTLATAMEIATVDFVKSFAPVGIMSSTPYVLVVPPSVKANTVAELVALAKSMPGKLNCGSSGMGTPGHLGCEMFKNMAGIDMVHVPYRSANAVLNGLIANDIHLVFAVAVTARGQIESGSIRPLAVLTPEPTPLLAGIPTMQDSGFPGFVVTGWGSVVAPAGTPPDIVRKLNAALVRISQNPDYIEKLKMFGQSTGQPFTPEQFKDFIGAEIARWNKAIDIARVPRGYRATK